tara:strand:- start:605 stop:763 length:159 start_codon:yes stop_codon:yes gene_type:complete
MDTLAKIVGIPLFLGSIVVVTYLLHRYCKGELTYRADLELFKARHPETNKED